MRSIYRTSFLPAAAVCVLMLSGCGGGDIGQVTGTIHLDGKPLPDAVVEFYPEAGGSASYGKTDAEGKYELHYNRQKKGAVIGKHIVKITTEDMAAGYGDESEEGTFGRTEAVPTKYNVDSQLTADVKGGANVIDFLELDSEGEVFQRTSEY